MKTLFINKFRMRTKKMVLLNQRYLPRWAVFSLDIAICMFSYLLMFVILDGTPLKFHDALPMPARAASPEPPARAK